MNKKIKKAVILLGWLILWQIIAVFVNSPIYFATPYETVRELSVKIRDLVFWQSVGGTLLRILSGFLLSFVTAYIAAFISHRFPLFGDFISPLITFLKSVPVAAVVVILLIWWGPRYLVLCIALMVVFPNIYLNMLAGLKGADKDLLRMASVFEISPLNRLLWIYRPSYLPTLLSSASVSLGMCFKAGIAAEIIGLPDLSIGERLYRDKIYLNTAGVFAWVIVILIVSFLAEKLILSALNAISKVPKACVDKADPKDVGYVIKERGDIPSGYTVFSDRIRCSFDDREVIDTEVKLKEGKIYYLDDPSGTGKTTLLSLIAGLKKPDSGVIKHKRCGMVFQDDCLIDSANGIRNLMVAGCTKDLKEEFLKLLPEHILIHPVSKLSKGEKRRIAIIRAMMYPSDIVIMDEPFAGLDEDTKKAAAAYIKANLSGRTLVIASHEKGAELFPDAIKCELVNSVLSS